MGSPSDKGLESRRLGEDTSPTLRRLIVPSLAISNLTSAVPILIVSLFLVDIARSFGVPVGVAGQLQTAFSAVTVIVALLLGVLSVRFGHKQLIIIGLFFVSVSALGCYFVQDLATMLLVYSMSGFGWAIVGPMSGAMIGEHLPVEKRGTAMGWIIAGMASAFLIGAPVIGLLGDWRLSFLAFALPIALLSLFLALRILPSPSSRGQVSSGAGKYLQGFREILGNRSAMACLLGVVLRNVSFQVIQVYSLSFYRQRHL